MENVLYKDEKYELYIEKGIYILINGDKYEISYHPYVPNTYIISENGLIKIVKSSWFYPGDVVKNFQNNEKINLGKNRQFSPLEFCEIIHSEILKERSKTK